MSNDIFSQIVNKSRGEPVQQPTASVEVQAQPAYIQAIQPAQALQPSPRIPWILIIVVLLGWQLAIPDSKYSPINIGKALIERLNPTDKPVDPADPTDPSVDPASSTMIPAVVEVVKKADAKKAKRLGNLYLAMADVLDRADPMSSSQLRAWLIASDTYMIKGTDLVGSVSGFGAVKDKLFTDLLGLETRQLTKDQLSEAAKLCRQIAASCGAK